jgi:solute:Na+ symporter, SSS family
VSGILDSVIIVISLALVIGAVLRAAGKKQTDAEYFLAGRALLWPFIGMSLLVSTISAEHVVGLAGDGYRVGMVTGGFEWMAAWCLIILASLFVPLYLRSRIYTIHWAGDWRGAIDAGRAGLQSIRFRRSSTPS